MQRKNVRHMQSDLRLLTHCNYFLVGIVLGVTHRHLSDHLSEVVENTINDLEQSKVSSVHFFFIYNLDNRGSAPTNTLSQRTQ